MTVPNAGHYRITLGDMEVTAIWDGTLQAGTGLLRGIDSEEADAALQAARRPLPGQIYVSTFLIRHGDRLTMIDTGAGEAMAPAISGLTVATLRALGVDPAAVGTVLLTHLHGDHVGGLLDPAGNVAFPQAELVMHERERAFWLDGGVPSDAPDQVRNAARNAQRYTAPYRDRIRAVSGGEVVPGISIEPLFGHSPGHSGFILRSGTETLLVWGDIAHYPALQIARPELGVAFDTDPAQARATRAAILARAAEDELLVAGMHLEFPTFGHIVPAEGSGYRFIARHWHP